MKCEICNKEVSSIPRHINKDHKDITSKEYYIKYISKGEHLCPVCGKENKFRDFSRGFTVFCSEVCRYSEEGKKYSSELYKKTNLEKYGVENYSKTEECKDKIKQTNLEKYGVDHYSKTDEFINNVKETSLEKYGVENYSKTEEYKEKYKNTCLENYGVVNSFQIDEVKDKIKITNLEKYGSNHYNKTEEGKEKYKNTCLEKYGVENISKLSEVKELKKETSLKNYGKEYYTQTEEYKEKSEVTRKSNYWNTYKTLLEHKKIEILFDKEYFINNNKDFNFKCLKCGKEFSIYEYKKAQSTYCKRCNKSISNEETEVLDFIKSIYSGEIITNKRWVLNNDEKEVYNQYSFELDIYIPEFNLGIEYDGVYWHSELHKEKDYHLNKTNFFKSKDNDIIHIFSNEWKNKEDIIKSIIKNKLILNSKIYARKCDIRELTNKDYNLFLDENHIQGSINSTIRVGLYYEDELVSCIGIGKSRFNKDIYELYRMVTKKEYSIIGGFSKLLNYLRNYDIEELDTYCDRRYFNGKGYQAVGFKFVSYTEPSYYYRDSSNILHNRMNFMKHKLKDKLKIFDECLTEHENMLNNGYTRIYDCGNIKYNIKIKDDK